MLRRSITITRLGAFQSQSGGQSQRASSTTVNILATVSPMSPGQVQAAFASTQGRTSYRVVSASRMYPFSASTPDRLSIDGENYECRNVTKSANNVKPHYAAIFTSLVGVS